MASNLLTFELDGKGAPPAQPPKHFPQPIYEAGFAIDPALVEKGEDLYATQGCLICHGLDGIAGGMAPDLRASAIPLSEMEPVFKAVVRDGQRVPRGMPAFAHLRDEDMEALRHYIRARAHEGADEPASP